MDGAGKTAREATTNEGHTVFTVLTESAALVAVHAADLPTNTPTQRLSQKTSPRRIWDGVNLEGPREGVPVPRYLIRYIKGRARGPTFPELHTSLICGDLLFTVLLERKSLPQSPSTNWIACRKALYTTHLISRRLCVAEAQDSQYDTTDDSGPTTNQARGKDRQGHHLEHQAAEAHHLGAGQIVSGTFVERGTAFHHRPARIPRFKRLRQRLQPTVRHRPKAYKRSTCTSLTPNLALFHRNHVVFSWLGRKNPELPSNHHNHPDGEVK